MSDMQIKKVYGTFTINPELLAELIRKEYGLQVQSEFHYIDSGFVNANFKFITESGAYVTRFYGKYSDYTAQELIVQSQLADRG